MRFCFKNMASLESMGLLGQHEDRAVFRNLRMRAFEFVLTLLRNRYVATVYDIQGLHRRILLYIAVDDSGLDLDIDYYQTRVTRLLSIAKPIWDAEGRALREPDIAEVVLT